MSRIFAWQGQNRGSTYLINSMVRNKWKFLIICNSKKPIWVLKSSLLIFFLAASCSSTPLPKNDSVYVPDDFFGIVHAGKTGTAREYRLLDDLGAKWILNTFYWRSIESEQGKFDFSNYDDFVDAAKIEGKKIVAVLGYEAPWLKNGKRYYISPENVPHFLRFVEETVRHFQGRVDVWSVWNEPNIHFWKGPNKEFFELSRLAAQRIRETDPASYIIGGVFWQAPRQFIKGMFKAGAIKDLDGLAFHPYALNPAGSMKAYDRLIDVLSEIGYDGPVWVTEVGFPTKGFFLIDTSIEELPSYLVKTLTGAAARGSRALLWYEMFDGYNEGEIPFWLSPVKKRENSFGLVYPGYQWKNGAFAYELCAKLLPGSRYAPQLPNRNNVPKTLVAFCFLEGSSGNNTLIVWKDSGRAVKVDLHLPGPGILYDISTGTGSPLAEKDRLDVGKEPLIVSWQGPGIPLLSMP